MQAIYDKAEELADLIAQSRAYKTLAEAERMIDDNLEVKRIVDQFNEQAAKIAEKERKVEAIEPEEKRELQRLREQVQSNEMLQQLLRAQTDYAMMMNKVNSILQSRLQRGAEKKQE